MAGSRQPSVASLKYLGNLRMQDRLTGIVGQKVLLGDIGDVFQFRILNEQMIERLILVRPHFLKGSTTTIPSVLLNSRIDPK